MKNLFTWLSILALSFGIGIVLLDSSNKTSTIATQSTQIELVVAENNQLAEDLAALLAQAEEALADAEAEYAELLASKVLLLEDHAELEARYARLEEDVETLNTWLEEYITRATNAEEGLVIQYSQILDLQADIELLNSSIFDLQVELAFAQNHIGELEELGEETALELQIAQTQAFMLQNSINNLELVLNATTSALQVAKAELLNLQIILEDYEYQITSLTNVLLITLEELDLAEDARDLAQAQLALANAEVETLEVLVSNLNQTQTTLSLLIETTFETYVLSDNYPVEGEYPGMSLNEGRVEALGLTIAALRMQLQASLSNLAILQQDFDTATATISHLQQQLQAVVAGSEQYIQTISTLQQELNAALEAQHLLEVENADLQAQVTAAQSDNDVLALAALVAANTLTIYKNFITAFITHPQYHANYYNAISTNVWTLLMQSLPMSLLQQNSLNYNDYSPYIQTRLLEFYEPDDGGSGLD